MTDWHKIESVLDDRSVAHACAYCGERIPAGNEDRWSIAVRRLDGNTSVLWVHAPCFLQQLHPNERRLYLPSGPAAPTS